MNPSFERPQNEFPQDAENENDESSKRERKHTSKRLALAIEANLVPLVGDVTVSGMENINELKREEKLVIATTHVSDLDVPLAIKALANHFDIAVSDDSNHHDFFKDPAGNVGIKLAGQENFIPIDYAKTDTGKQARFNVDNFIPMVEAMENGKEVIVAAHNPSDKGQLESGGIGAVYLAQISNAAILPVAVDIEGEAFRAGKNTIKVMRERPNAGVFVGKPLRLPHIEGIERYKEIMDKRKTQKLDKSEIAEFGSLTEELRKQSDIVMKALSAMIPAEKQGPYTEGIK